MKLTTPTLLTLTRIVAIPVMLGVYYLPMPQALQDWLATIMFAVFACTDWLDGYLARRLGQASSFGAFLDPVADKFLVSAALLLLLHLGRVDLFVALIIIGREIAVSALREWMARVGQTQRVAVHRVGKLKTTLQLLAIGFLLFNGKISLAGQPLFHSLAVGMVLIWLAALLTVWSMVYYLREAWPAMRQEPKK